MAGLAEPIKLREFTDHNPQIRIEDVYPGMAPRRGKTLQGLYVGEVGRRHVEDPNKISLIRRYYQGMPDHLELPVVRRKSNNGSKTVYNRSYTSQTFVPLDFKYTPTSHFKPLPIGAKSPPVIKDPSDLS